MPPHVCRCGGVYVKINRDDTAAAHWRCTNCGNEITQRLRQPGKPEQLPPGDYKARKNDRGEWTVLAPARYYGRVIHPHERHK